MVGAATAGCPGGRACAVASPAPGAGAGWRAESEAERRRRAGEADTALAAREAAASALGPVLAELGGLGIGDLDAAVQASRRLRAERERLAAAEAEALAGGDGHGLDALVEQWAEADPDAAASRADALGPLLVDANARVTAAAEALSAARLAFERVDVAGGNAASAAADAEQARAEMAVQAEGDLFHQLARATRATSMVRFGTSSGLSTSCLAAALRNNGGGRLVTAEFEPSKVARAWANLSDAASPT